MTPCPGNIYNRKLTMAARKIFKYVMYDILRSKLIISYTILLFAISFGIIYTGKDVSKAVISLLNIVILIVPLISIIFGTIHFYNSREFMEMMLAMLQQFFGTGFGSFFSMGFLFLWAVVPTFLALRVFNRKDF